MNESRVKRRPAAAGGPRPPRRPTRCCSSKATWPQTPLDVRHRSALDNKSSRDRRFQSPAFPLADTRGFLITKVTLSESPLIAAIAAPSALRRSRGFAADVTRPCMLALHVSPYAHCCMRVLHNSRALFH